MENKDENHYYGFALSRSRFAPGCVYFGGFAKFINDAATPPFCGRALSRLRFAALMQGGECAAPRHCDIFFTRP
jgi:hypothetical protein